MGSQNCFKYNLTGSIFPHKFDELCFKTDITTIFSGMPKILDCKNIQDLLVWNSKLTLWVEFAYFNY